MATTRKPAARTAAKKTTRRTTRKPAPRKAPIKEPEVTLTQEELVLQQAQLQAKLQAYAVLKNAQLPIPADLAADVEPFVRAAQEQAAAEQAAYDAEQAELASVAGPKYVRNGYPGPFSIRLDRQEKGKKRIELKPRGQRGDLHPLEDGDERDPAIIQALENGLIEIVTSGQAQQIIKNQVNNRATQVHTPTAILRNELGQAYAPENIKIEAEFNSQGVTVAHVDPASYVNQLAKQSINAGGLQRVQPGQELVSQFYPTGGNPAIISSGAPADLVAAKVADDIARRRGTQGPEAGVGGLSVSVEPVRKT